jgi:hypothetical protein
MPHGSVVLEVDSSKFYRLTARFTGADNMKDVFTSGNYKLIGGVGYGIGDFSNGGEATGGNRTLGNTDNYSLGIKTNNIDRIKIKADGDVDVVENFTAKTIESDGLLSFYGVKFPNADGTINQLMGTDGSAQLSWANLSSFQNVFEKELTAAETNIAVGFTIDSKALVYLNGDIIKSSQWSGAGTTTLILTLNILQYDNFQIKQ